MVIFMDGKRFVQNSYKFENDFELDIIRNNKRFFGEKTVYINSKQKLASKSLGGAVPDGILFDFTDLNNPSFYLVEIELASHDFYRHIFPQVTKFFSSLKEESHRNELVEKIFSLIISDLNLNNEFKAILGEKEIYKFIHDTIESNRNILLVLDGEKDELNEIQDTYSETWGKIVRIIIIQKFVEGTRSIYSLNPEFRDIDYIPGGGEKDFRKKSQYSEQMHLDELTDDIKKQYLIVKKKILKLSSELSLNTQKYYISVVYNRNIAFILFRKNRIEIIIMLPEREIKKRLKYHKVKSLSEGVQKFYNGPCAAVVIDKPRQIDEVISLIRYLVRNSE